MTGLVIALGLVVSAPCRVSGRVVDGFSGEPLSGVRVSGPTGSVETEAGTFELEVPCEEVRVRFERLDYRPTARVVRVEDSVALEVALEPREIDRIDDVIVEAPAPAISDPRSSITLDSDALRRTRGRSLADSLAEVPGVVTLRSGATSKPIIRGQQGRRVLIVFDGIRHESQKWGLDHAPEIDPFAAGSITVVKGASGVRYGPDAIGGVILLEPHPFAEDGLSGSAHQIFESNGRQGTLALRLDSVNQAIDGLSLRMDGNVQRRASLDAPDYPLDNTAGATWNLGARAQWEGDGYEVELSARRHDFENGIFSAILSETPGAFFASIERGVPLGVDDFERSYDFERPYQDVVHDIAIARGRVSLGDAGALELTFGFQDDARREFDVARRSVTRPQADFSLRTSQLELAWEQPSWELRERALLSGTVGVVGWRQANVYRGLPLIPNYRALNLGAFALERLRLGAVDVELGARVDVAERDAFLTDNAFTALRRQGRADEEVCTLNGESATCASDFTGTSASLGATWRLAEGASLSAEISTATRFPTIDEQYLNGTAPSFPAFALGDPRLDAETTQGGSITGKLDRSWIAAELSVWVQRISDYIYFAPALGPDGEPIVDVLISGSYPRFSFTQLDASFWGGEGAAALTPFAVPLTVELSAAVVRGQDSEGGFLVLVPPDRGRVEVRYDLAEWLGRGELSLNVSHVRRQDRVDLNADFAPPPAAYTLVGARVGTGFAFEGGDLNASLEVSNLFDEAYRDYTSLLRYFADEPGRTVVLRVAQDF